MTNTHSQWWWGAYLTALSIFSIFSFSLTAPNLILSNWSPYWNFQLFMWKTFFNNRPLLAYSFVAIFGLLFITYFGLLYSLRHRIFSVKKLICLVALAAAPLLFSANALSYDVFNYIFNAKMVVVYHANPHQHVALDYAYDDWTRFMHNTHTPAPYGYGWTALSLIPFTLGAQHFTITWMLFRLFSVASLVGLAWLLAAHLTYARRWWVLVILLNPLLLIEVVSNSHNDLWMMVPAVASLLLLTKKKTLRIVALSLLLLGLSISIKFASAVLLPIWLLLVLNQQLVRKYWALLASLLLFCLLLTDRSQQFHPWYLTWVLVWLPFIEDKTWRWSVIALSTSSLFRYVAYFWAGTYTPAELIQEKMITWVPWAIATVGLVIHRWRGQANTVQ